MTASKDNLFCGVDVGGTKIAVVIADASGRTMAQGVVATESCLGPVQAIERTHSLIQRLCGADDLCPVAIGLGLPGLVDPQTGKILLLPNLPSDWNAYPFASMLETQTQLPVFALNDARLAALGEYTFGCSGLSEDLLFVTLGTGVGGGFVLDGRLRLGAFGAAGELGHQTIIPDGLTCGCGNHGCLETLINGPALAAAGRDLMERGLAPRLFELVNGQADRVTALNMATAAKSGDGSLSHVIGIAAEYVGVGIANAITIAGVSNVVVGGGLASLGTLLLEPIRRVVRERVKMFPSESVQVRCSSLGDICGALGGVAFAAQQFSKTKHYGRREPGERP